MSRAFACLARFLLVTTSATTMACANASLHPATELAASEKKLCPRAASKHGASCRCDEGEAIVLGACMPDDLVRELAMPKLEAGDPSVCPAGTLLNRDEKRCAPVVFDARGPAVDVATWVKLAVGDDGALGTSPLCDSLATAAVAFNIAPASRATYRIHYVVRIPEGDLTRVRGESSIESLSASRPLTEAGQAWAYSRTRGWTEALRSLGGRATVDTFSVHVACTISRAALPVTTTKLQWLSNLP